MRVCKHRIGLACYVRQTGISKHTCQPASFQLGNVQATVHTNNYWRFLRGTRCQLLPARSGWDSGCPNMGLLQIIAHLLASGALTVASEAMPAQAIADTPQLLPIDCSSGE
ncbi:hypothetical protein HaLaN_30562 [Haematococcus lacustris]|uniref:Uncharacterized protein n=1 Tax=Haematococcus lacustris TaxID=44745 RepID=A0A6A0AFX8_HAELA|nr:hypothetical protein HaLaN_30562 [Haematococcus lacustris]